MFEEKLMHKGIAATMLALGLTIAAPAIAQADCSAKTAAADTTFQTWRDAESDKKLSPAQVAAAKQAYDTAHAAEDACKAAEAAAKKAVDAQKQK